MQRIRSLDPRMVTILLIIFVQILGASMILPILPLLAKREFAMSDQTITLLVTAFFAAQFLAGPTIGRLSDRYGRVPVLIISQIGTALSFMMLAWSPTVMWLFIARLIDGITGGNIIVARAYIIDITSPEKRTESLGLLFAAFGFGFILGPALGGVLSALFGLRVPYIMAAVAATIVVLLTWFTLDETVTAEEQEQNQTQQSRELTMRRVVQNRALVQVLLVVFVSQFGLAMLQATFSLFGEVILFAGYDERVTSLGIGLLLATFGVMLVIVQAVLLPRMLKRFEEAKIVIFGMIVRSFGLIALGLSIGPLYAVLAIVLFASGHGGIMPSLNALTTRTVSEQLRGEVQGVYQSVYNLAIIISTAIAGVIFAIEPSYPFFIAAVMSIFAVLPTIPLIGRYTAAPTPMD